jgi:hypothetical protein
MHLLVLHEAWRCLDVLPGWVSQSYCPGPFTRIQVHLRNEDRSVPHLHEMRHRASGHEPNRRLPLRCRQRQRVRRCGSVASSARIRNVRGRERRGSPCTARAKLDSECRVHRELHLTSNCSRRSRAGFFSRLRFPPAFATKSRQKSWLCLVSGDRQFLPALRLSTKEAIVLVRKGLQGAAVGQSSLPYMHSVHILARWLASSIRKKECR